MPGPDDGGPGRRIGLAQPVVEHHAVEIVLAQQAQLASNANLISGAGLSLAGLASLFGPAITSGVNALNTNLVNTLRG